jgi:hypothetical protein
VLKSWILNVEEDKDTGDAILIFPPDLLEAAELKEGDNLHWIDNKDGSWSIIKEEDLTNFLKKGIISNEQN